MARSSCESVTKSGAPVRLQGLRKAYGDTVAVRDVTLSVNPGEFITLLGPSGSGKSTTLMMIAGFVPPSDGEIYIDGRPVARIPPESRELGMVFQSYALFPHMTIAQNIAFPLKMRRWPRQEIGQKVAAALEMVKLPGYEERSPRQLSGGQQQRIALARAIVFEPRVLLMDEPLGSLDKKLRDHMQAEIKRIQQQLNITVIYVTHDQEEALTMSDRIVVMHEGCIQQVGTPTALYDEPANTFVADFIGEANFMSGTVSAVDASGMISVRHRSGQVFRAVGRRAVECGMEVVASIRPERLTIVTGMVVDPGYNHWKGRVAQIIFVGDATKYKIALEDMTLTVKAQNQDLKSGARVGDDVTVIWRPAHTALLHDDANSRAC
jgi:putative spermidine/putrescine transport system ATP-binding protein